MSSTLLLTKYEKENEMPATRSNPHTSQSSRDRLPLTPKVTSVRRGAHAPVEAVTTEHAPSSSVATREFHLTPNVVSATRGGALEGTWSMSKALRGTPRRGRFAV